MSQTKGNPFNLHLHSLYSTLACNNVARTLCVCGVEIRLDALSLENSNYAAAAAVVSGG